MLSSLYVKIPYLIRHKSRQMIIKHEKQYSVITAKVKHVKLIAQKKC